MAYHDPQQEIFATLRGLLIAEYGEDAVYDGGNPPLSTPYPFLYLGETTENAEMYLKDAASARVSITVHAWHDDPGKRGTVSSMITAAIVAAGSITSTSNYNVHLLDESHDILPDTSTKVPLLHGVVTLTFIAFRR